MRRGPCSGLCFPLLRLRAVQVVARRLGHADPAVTLRTYAHVLADQAAEVATLFASLVDTSNEGPTDAHR